MPRRRSSEPAGVDEVTLDEIARQADVGKGTIYLYFTDKEDVIFQSAMAGFDEMCRSPPRHLRRRRDVPGTPAAGACERIVVFFRERRPLFRIVLSEGERAMESGGTGLRQRWRERRRSHDGRGRGRSWPRAWPRRSPERHAGGRARGVSDGPAAGPFAGNWKNGLSRSGARHGGGPLSQWRPGAGRDRRRGSSAIAMSTATAPSVFGAPECEA